MANTLNNLRYNLDTKRLEAAGGTPEWNAIELDNETVTPSGNTKYVNGATGNDSNTGGPTDPFATINAAMSAIGSATTIAEYNNAATARWMVEVSPGIYTENVNVPTRQFINIQLHNADIEGNVTQSFNGNVIDSAQTIQSKLVVRGDDLRARYPGSKMPFTGITGSVIFTVTSTGMAPFMQFHLMESGIGGNFHTFQNGVNFDTSLVLENAQIIGGILSTAGAAITLYAHQCDDSTSQGIGTIAGEVSLYVLENVAFTGAISPTGQDGGRWFGVVFPSAAHDFSQYAGTVGMDANSFASFFTNVPTKGTFTKSLIDKANGVGYTPTTSGDWSVVPTTVQQALDLLAAKAKP